MYFFVINSYCQWWLLSTMPFHSYVICKWRICAYRTRKERRYRNTTMRYQTGKYYLVSCCCCARDASTRQIERGRNRMLYFPSWCLLTVCWCFLQRSWKHSFYNELIYMQVNKIGQCIHMLIFCQNSKLSWTFDIYTLTLWTFYRLLMLILTMCQWI